MEEDKATVIGPTIPLHLVAKMNEERMPIIGPTLPAPHLVSSVDSEADTPSQKRRVMGPTMPPSAGEEEPKLSAAAQSFLDREKRMKEAEERKASGLAPLKKEEISNRPDWMLAPPTAQSYTEILQKDPSAALKGRGFSQAQNTRVQKGRGGAGMSGLGEEDMSLWTETPQEREKRLMEEEMGIRPKVNSVRRQEDEEDRLKRIADQKREEQLQIAIREHNDQRGPSLLEQHQAKRRTEVKSTDSKRRKEEGSTSRKRRDISNGDDSGSESHSRNPKQRLDERKRSERYSSHSASESDSEAERRRRRKHRSSHRGEDRDDRQRRSHHSNKDRDRDQDRDKERDQRRMERHKEKEIEKDREREKRRKRKEREKKEKEEKRGAPMMVWDREAALSVGGKLMDTQKRMDTIRSASGLGSRFGSGSARYL